MSFDKLNKQIREEVLSDLECFFDSKQYVLGSQLERFEASYASFSSTKYCIGVGSGLSALHLSLLALGIGEGDEIIVPGYGYLAAANNR